MKKNQKGFAVLEGLLIVIIVGLIGFVGWYIWHNSATKSPSSSTTTVLSNPYAGWKSYCDTKTNGCFKYPANWSIDPETSNTSSDDFVYLSISNPSKSVLVSYSSPYSNPEKAGPGQFYAAAIEPLAASSSLKVVGGMFTVNNTPAYEIVNNSQLKTYPLSIGDTSDFEWANNGFTNKGSTTESQLNAVDNALGSTKEPEQAKAWFKSEDAKTSLLILKSFYYKTN